MLCGGAGCSAGGNLKIKDALIEQIKNKGLDREVSVQMTSCNGFCPQGPIMIIYPDNILYQKVSLKDVASIVDEHLIKGKIIDKLIYKEPAKKQSIPVMKDIPFFNKQVLRVLRNKGLIDPESLEQYIARDGYQAAGKALFEMTPEDIIDLVKKSGLRGRGGAGALTGMKWEQCAKIKAPQKFIVCNRSIIEVEPHLIIEGMIICARAIGASKGFIYVRSIPVLIDRLQKAIDQAMENGLLGEGILGSDFNLELEIFKSSDEFVCGEETALLMSIQSKRGMPTPRPPFPVEKGLWEMPTVINTVETFANIPLIILKGAEWFRSAGTELSPGTKIFSLSGPINNTGLIEVPMGITLKSVINDIGGGVVKGRKFKAVQVGGSTGGYIPEEFLSLPITYEDVTQMDAIIGSGGIYVISDLNCMVSSAKFTIEFAVDESCGKCPPCRIGTTVLFDLLNNITQGKAKPEDIDLMEDLSKDIKNTSLCGLGQTAMNPVLSTIRFFRDEYLEHINEKWCKAGVCKELCTFFVDKEKCIGCGACARVCPKKAISGEKKKPHNIDQTLCIQCRACYETCKFNALKVGPRHLREELMIKMDEQKPPDATINNIEEIKQENKEAL